MDKNTVTGLVIIGALLLGFMWYNGKQAEEYSKQKSVQDSIALAAYERDVTQAYSSPPDSVVRENSVGTQDSVDTSYLGSSLSLAKNGQQSDYVIENEVMKVTFSNKGGKISNVELKDYKTYRGEPLMMSADESANIDLSYFIQKGFNNAQINTSDYYFTTEGPKSVVVDGEQSGQSISMRLWMDSTAYMEFLYVMKKGEYMMDFKVNFVNMGDVLSNQSDMVFTWDAVGPQQEKGFENENNYTDIKYKYPGEDSLEELGLSKATKEVSEPNMVQWVAFKQQFFSSVFIADKNFQDATMRYDTYVPTDTNIKKFHASMAVPFNKSTTEYGFKFYYGPNKYTILKQYDGLYLQKIVPLGWGIIGWINRYAVIPIFDWLSGSIANVGLIILILTLLLKLVITPLTYKSYLSGAKMRLLKPEIEQITAKYPKQEDAMKKQQATMALYKQAGVSPMGGCFPMLIQFPILIAMFRFFPASIELRGQSFLWADDLSSYDSILDLPFDIPFYGDHISLFTILMAVTMYLSSKINMSQQSTVTAPGMGGMKFMMLYLMPIMLLVWFNNYASGLTYYYFLSTTISIVQMVGMRYIVNDEKLHARMKANVASNAKKPKKQSKWQQRYSEMVKQQQQVQKQKQKRK